MLYFHAMAFRDVDFMKLDRLLSQEENLIKESVRSFVEDHVIPIIEDHYMEGKFPTELVRLMGQQGYL